MPLNLPNLPNLRNIKNSILGKTQEPQEPQEPFNLDAIKAKIDPIEAEIDKRYYYDERKLLNDEQRNDLDKYQSELAEIKKSSDCLKGDSGSSACNEKKNNLLDEKLRNIRKHLKNKGIPETEVIDLVSNISMLEDISDTIKKEEERVDTKRHKLVDPDAQRFYLTKDRRDAAKIAYETAKNPLDKQSKELSNYRRYFDNNIIYPIKKLDKIYKESPPPTSQPSQPQPSQPPQSANPTGGSKKKTRRNRKSNKSRKNRRKSKRRY